MAKVKRLLHVRLMFEFTAPNYTRLTILAEGLHGFPQFFQTNSGIVPTGYDHFFPDPFQFTICNLCMVNPVDKRSLNKETNKCWS
jgi:hypothetical protein